MQAELEQIATSRAPTGVGKGKWIRSSVVDASDKKETVAGTLDIAGVESPEELAQQVAQLRLAPQGMPALQGSYAAEAALPLEGVCNMVAEWALAEDNVDVQELEVTEAFEELNISAEEQICQQQQADREQRLREQEEEEERLADEKTCPSMAEALAACATMAKYARHRMDDRDLQRALACAQSIRRHNIKAKAQMKQIPLVELWRRGK